MSTLAETRTAIPAGTWSIDPAWSALEFEVKKIGLVAVKGRVPGFSGTIVGGAPAPPTFSINDPAPVAAARRWLLQYQDFFNSLLESVMNFLGVKRRPGDASVVVSFNWSYSAPASLRRE